MNNFSKVRAFLWPIHGFEMAKFMPMGLMMFCVLFNYTALRTAKDSLMITGCGAEVIPFLKGWIILPLSALFVAGYSKLLNRYSQQSLFYGIISTFLIFFTIFTFYIHPNRELLHPDPAYIEAMKLEHPHFQHLIALYGSWSYATFYLFAESWSAIALGLLFWQFANEITSTKEAKRFYGMLAFLGHFALIAAGYMAMYFCDISASTDGDLNINSLDAWSEYLKLTVVVVNLCGFTIMGLYWWMQNHVLIKPQYMPAKHESKAAKPKVKMTVMEGFAHVFRSKYIGLISLLVFGYAFTMNLLGLMWKNQVKLQYPEALDYAHFMGSFYMATGFITVTILFFFKGVVSNFGWLRGAIITPMAILITSVLFFAFIFYQDSLSPLMALYGVTPLLMAVWISTFQQFMSKSCKYSLFDPTKEMAYIPLDPVLRSKGKAAVDVTGHLFSKASGGYFTGIILMVTAAGDLMSVAPLFACAVMIVLAVWVWAVLALNKEYTTLTHAADMEEASRMIEDPSNSDDPMDAGKNIPISAVS
ncbi:MAG: NTP/NDP exchange transporter [Alphaproteobacteria bacterium]|nr:NTP/NDP exchange transporter [Alphaproteobacteria bacterium]